MVPWPLSPAAASLHCQRDWQPTLRLPQVASSDKCFWLFLTELIVEQQGFIPSFWEGITASVGIVHVTWN